MIYFLAMNTHSIFSVSSLSSLAEITFQAIPGVFCPLFTSFTRSHQFRHTTLIQLGDTGMAFFSVSQPDVEGYNNYGSVSLPRYRASDPFKRVYLPFMSARIHEAQLGESERRRG